ncbi:MAG TPA: PQQ-dependent sugar dehydrogenase [Lacipirellulaceae bacterium]
MRSNILLILSFIGLSLTLPIRTAAQTYAERIVGGFGFPMFGTFVPGDENRLFVGRIWTGEIQIIDLQTRTVLPQPFLEIEELPDPLAGVEQGFLGLTFDPDYATNGYFYVNFTGIEVIDGTTYYPLNVRRYRISGDPATSNVADPNSGQTILKIPKTAWWHNAGWIEFGPNDGYLYVNVGAPAGTDAQDITDNLHGKILRIDVRSDAFPADPSRNYAIPASNPFVGKEGDDEIWAYGLRNPFRASFDRQTGDLWINDTGEGNREEVNYQPAQSAGGENYAWPRREGTAEGPGGHGGPLLPEYTEPIYDYPHVGPDPLFRGNVIAASGYYRGPVDAFYGHYFFADNGSRNIWKLDPDAVDPRASVTNVNSLLLPNTGFINRVPSFGEDAAGNLYLMDYDNAPNGEVFRVATASKDAVWNGNNAQVGVIGDGTTWSDPSNWSRDGVADQAFVDQDNVIFANGSSQPVIDLGEDRVVAAVTFGGPYRLQNRTLKILSGNVIVEQGVTAIIDSTLLAETVHHTVRKLGPGTLIVNGDAGQIAVKEGILRGNGTVDHLTIADGGRAGPGAALGSLTVEDSFTMHSGAALEIELAGTIPGVQHDRVVVGGTAKLHGNLDVSLVGNFQPSHGDVYEVLSAGGGVSGNFTSATLPSLANDLAWRVVYDEFAVQLLVALSGDYDVDGAVTAADYVSWRNTLGSTSQLAADGNGNGSIDDGDYQLWRSNFGATVQTNGGNETLNIPEATGSVLLMLGALHFGAWRRAIYYSPRHQSERRHARRENRRRRRVV